MSFSDAGSEYNGINIIVQTKEGKNKKKYIGLIFLEGNNNDFTYKQEKTGPQKPTKPAHRHKWGKFRKKVEACSPKLIEIIEIEKINPANNLAEKASFLLLQNKIFPTSKPKIPIANTNKKYPSPS